MTDGEVKKTFERTKSPELLTLAMERTVGMDFHKAVESLQILEISTVLEAEVNSDYHGQEKALLLVLGSG